MKNSMKLSCFFVMILIAGALISAAPQPVLTELSSEWSVDLGREYGILSPHSFVRDGVVRGSNLYLLAVTSAAYSARIPARVIVVNAEGRLERTIPLRSPNILGFEPLPGSEIQTIELIGGKFLIVRYDASGNSTVGSLVNLELAGSGCPVLAISGAAIACVTFDGRMLLYRQQDEAYRLALNKAGLVPIVAPSSTCSHCRSGVIRPVVARTLPPHAALFVETSEARVHLVNLATAAIASFDVRTPRIEASLKTREKIAKHQPGTTIIAAAGLPTGDLFFLLSPWNRTEGAIVEQTGIDGTPKRTLVCPYSRLFIEFFPNSCLPQMTNCSWLGSGV